MFDWNDLRYFLAVARTGAAAKALGCSQSTVQRRLARLERQLGCKLVERHPTGYRLTPQAPTDISINSDAIPRASIAPLYTEVLATHAIHGHPIRFYVYIQWRMLE